ncbi:MAG TPA: YggS family pyridoxal phosphate-dependent enzyme [Trueperaceae bacterium]|nr:YggS family pyridoxal phosphate-dependent enzyme [Trueperaceae bacterium]
MAPTAGLPRVLERIEAACARSRRAPDEVRLVAVTKGHDAAEIERRVLAHGHRILGENRVQEWLAKRAALPADVEWHLVGHLQRNKVKYLAGVRLIHSLDSARLADALEAEAETRDARWRVLLEVNVAGEAAKFGIAPAEAADLVAHVRSLPHVELEGLMTMAPYSDDPEASRPVFRELRRLGDRLGVPGLSMGMSADFEVAVEEGATWVRVGTALFE